MTTLMGNILHIPDENIVLLPILSVQDINNYITLIEYNLITRNLRSVFDDNKQIIDLTSSLKLNNIIDIQSPVLTYSPNLKIFNLSFISRKVEYDGDYLISIMFYIKNNLYEITKITQSTP